MRSNGRNHCSKYSSKNSLPMVRLAKRKRRQFDLSRACFFGSFSGWRRAALAVLLLLVLLLLCALATARFLSHTANTVELIASPINHMERDNCAWPSYAVVGHNNATSGSPKPRICLTTLTDAARADWVQRLVRWRNFDALLDITWPNKRRYCARHGYALYNESRASLDPNRPPSWSKIRAALRLLTEEPCDWVFWLDADTVIMNSAKRIEDFLPAPETGIDLVLTPQKGQSWNAGAWLIRNTPWSLEFLNHWWNMTDFVKPKGLGVSGDNDALKHYLTNMNPRVFAEHIAVPNRCLFNANAKWLTAQEAAAAAALPPAERSAPPKWYGDLESYHKGDFVAHVAGVDNKISTTLLLLKDAV